jgi:hypothetical protein
MPEAAIPGLRADGPMPVRPLRSVALAPAAASGARPAALAAAMIPAIMAESSGPRAPIQWTSRSERASRQLRPRTLSLPVAAGLTEA